MAALKIDTTFDDNLAWGLTGGAIGFLGVSIAILTLVRGINKEYFRINSLTIFGTYKVFGLYDYYLLWIGSILFAFISLISSILKDKSSYSCSISSILYTIFIIITYLYIFFKNDKGKYLKYLKNSGALRIKRRSSKMNQSVFFGYKHPKAKKFFQTFGLSLMAGSIVFITKLKITLPISILLETET